MNQVSDDGACPREVYARDGCQSKLAENTADQAVEHGDRVIPDQMARRGQASPLWTAASASLRTVCTQVMNSSR